jgi:hypothetical protein
MLNNTSLSTNNYNSLLTGWTGWINEPTKLLQDNVYFDVSPTKYSSGITKVLSARTYLETTKNWVITDGGAI